MMMRPALGLLLACLLSLTSVTMAVARGQMNGAMTVELCADHGAGATITLDAQGNPVATVLHCPDCLVATPAPGGAPVTVPARPVTRSEPQVCVLTLPIEDAETPDALARGPPPPV